MHPGDPAEQLEQAAGQGTAARRAGFCVSPRWQVLAPGAAADAGRIAIHVAAGRSFGDGRHPSTQLCLQAIAACAPRGGVDWRALDVGCGSGILAIAAARLGARVDAVEIDPGALEEAAGNLRHNGLSARVRLVADLASCGGPYELIVANILRETLLELAPTLCARLAADGDLVLAGLVDLDVPPVIARCAPWLDGARPRVVAHGPWRALWWRARAQPR